MNFKFRNLLRQQFDEIDNSPVILFRIVFGLLIFAESAGAILTSWVKEAFITPAYTFTFIGFEWLQPLPGYGMYFYYGVMAFLGLMVLVGNYYQISIRLFTLLWTLTYLMQKTHYNNHYYLLILICLFMCMIPANSWASIDVKKGRITPSITCPRWCVDIFKIQLWLVFTYASLAKIYPGWLEGDFISLIFSSKSHYPIIGGLLAQLWFQKFIVMGGLFFDLLIVYFLIWKRTRLMAFIAVIFFNLFNSAVFQIGVFPYLMIALCVFFFEPEKIRRKFFKNKPEHEIEETTDGELKHKNKLTLLGLSIYFIIQLILPLRHHLFDGNVFWTEEGHRMSWRMMLRSKSGRIDFLVKNITSDSTWIVEPKLEMTPLQANAMAGKPDMIWQFAQRLKAKYETQGISQVQIFARSRVRLNKSMYHPIVDENQDLSSAKWHHFSHSPWIISPFKD